MVNIRVANSVELNIKMPFSSTWYYGKDFKKTLMIILCIVH